MSGRIGILRKQEHHRATGTDGFPRGDRPIFARRNVSFSDPTFYLGGLKLFANCLRDVDILMRMTDENVVGHRKKIGRFGLIQWGSQ
jgi:hypothetical protein